MKRLALDMLLGDTARYLGITVGVAIAAFLISQQLALFNGLMDRITSTITSLAGIEIWVMDPRVQSAEDSKPLPDSQLARVRSITGVAWAVPFYKGNIRVRLSDGNLQAAILNGLDDASLVGGPAEMVAGSLASLRESGGIIVDENGANTRLATRGPSGQLIPLRIGSILEVNDTRAIVVGICKPVRTFQSQPVIYTTYSRISQFAPQERKRLSYILVKAQPGLDHATLSARIEQVTGLKAFTTAQFSERTQRYFIVETGIIATFLAGLIISFFVGTVISGQTFYNFTIENLRQFGAIKAMGASNATILGMVFSQAAMVGALGLGIGLGITSIVAWNSRNTELNMRFSTMQVSVTVIAVLCIVTFAAWLASRKVLRLDPAEVFKG